MGALRRILPSLIISVVLSGAMLAAFKYDVFESVERRLFDYRLRVRGQIPQSDKVVIAVISNDSVKPEELGRWPWPRYDQAFLVEALNKYGAKVIAYDVFFPEADENVSLYGLRKFLRANFEMLGLEEPATAKTDPQGYAERVKTFYNEFLGASFDQETPTPSKEDPVEENLNPDKVFAKTLAKYDDVILGYYFDLPEPIDKVADDLGPIYDLLIRACKTAGVPVPQEAKQDYKNIKKLLSKLEQAQAQSVSYSQRLKMVEDYSKIFEVSAKKILEETIQSNKEVEVALQNFYSHIEQQILLQLSTQYAKQLDNPNEEIKKLIDLKTMGMEGSAVKLVPSPRSVNPIVRAFDLPPNIELFTKNTKHFGHVTVQPEPDGVIRYNLPIIDYGNRMFPSLSVEAASLYENKPLVLTLMPQGEPPRLALGNRNIPLDDQGRLLINYHGAKNYPQYDIFNIMRSYITRAPNPENIPAYFNEVLKKTPEQYFQDLNGTPPKKGDIDNMIYSETIENQPISNLIVEWESEKMFEDKYGLKPAEAFKDKIVLVGATAIGVYDLRVTPFSENYPGVEIHAQVIDSILNNNFLSRPIFGNVYGLALIIGLAIVLGLIIPLISALRGAVVVMVLAAALVSVDYFYFFLNRGWWMPLFYPAMQMGVVFFAVTIYRYATEEKEKRFIKDTFGRYLAPSVIKKLTENPEMVKLGGEKIEMTAFFSDIQGFSTISEKLGSPELLVELLNDYLSEMANMIESYEGTVDKYEGDAIIAFWGAPVHFPDHAVKACFACLDQQVKLAELRQKWAKEGGWPQIVLNAKVRMGLNTGDMVVGNMGSAGRMNYTIMGDAVNLASRLEGANKPYGTYIMISEFTYKEAKDHIEVRELDSLRVMGKSEPVKVYELLARKGQLPPKKQRVIEVYNEGLAAYKQKDWDTGIARFTEALNIDPGDGPSKTYLARCQEYQIEPPGAEWDGVYTLLSK